MALGLIPIYNHSYKSNCEYFMDYDDETIFVKTVRAIEKGEELTINYNGDWDDATKVWFEVEPASYFIFKKNNLNYFRLEIGTNNFMHRATA